MMFLYLDSSALVKRYVDERHSETTEKLDESFLFGCFDNELTAAANEEGLRTWPDSR